MPLSTADHGLSFCLQPLLNDVRLIPRKRRFENILVKLIDREFNVAKPGTSANFTRKFYLNIGLDKTVVHVEKPAGFLRKFTPDGQLMLSFAAQQGAVDIFRYKGVACAGNLLRNVKPTDYDPAQTTLQAVPIPANTIVTPIVRQDLFHTLFKKLHSVQVVQGAEQLNRECSLFTADSRFVIVAASLQIHEDNPRFPHMFEMYRSNESLTVNMSHPLEDYWIYCVDLREGRLCDTRQYKCDRIVLPHNQGIYLYEHTLAIFSLQHQTVYLLKICDEGILQELRQIGRFLYEDDDLVMQNFLTPTFLGDGPRNLPLQPMADHTLNALKQRLLTFLYKDAVNKDAVAIRNFYKNFEFFRALRIWKMQLLDERHMLLRYASEDVVLHKVDANTQSSFFVFFDLVTTEVLAVYENLSEHFLEIYENFCDHFRLADTRFPASVSSSRHAREYHERFKQTIVRAQNGGYTEAIKRLTASVPLSAQSFSMSPYLDQELYSYDEKWVSAFERPKATSDFPIRFFARESGLFKFQVSCGLAAHPPQTFSDLSNPLAQVKQLVAFIFHPTDPLAISIQRYSSRDYVVNFHLRAPDD